MMRRDAGTRTGDRAGQIGAALMVAAQRRGDAAAAAHRARMAQRLGTDFPDLAVEMAGDVLILRGRNALARWVGDPRLRYVGRG
ncbi:MAG: hypothetical protein ACKOUM_07390 [Sphingopyxis sp.]